MLKNELFSIGPVTIYGYGLMVAIAIIAAYLTAEYRAKKKGLEHESVFTLTLWCLCGGIVGSKLLYFITIFDRIMEDPSIMLDFQNGFVVYGGILGGILGGFIYCRIKKWNFLEYFDLTMPEIALAQGIGRIGCFLAGCCYGKETDSPIGIAFHDSAFAPNNVKLIPTQLISAVLDVVLFGILLFVDKKKKKHGQVAAVYLILYSIGRFVVEIFRGDLERGNVGGLSTSQFIAIILLAAGIAMFVLVTIKGKGMQETADKCEETEPDEIAGTDEKTEAEEE